MFGLPRPLPVTLEVWTEYLEATPNVWRSVRNWYVSVTVPGCCCCMPLLYNHLMGSCSYVRKNTFPKSPHCVQCTESFTGNDWTLDGLCALLYWTQGICYLVLIPHSALAGDFEITCSHAWHIMPSYCVIKVAHMATYNVWLICCLFEEVFCCILIWRFTSIFSYPVLPFQVEVF